MSIKKEQTPSTPQEHLNMVPAGSQPEPNHEHTQIMTAILIIAGFSLLISLVAIIALVIISFKTTRITNPTAGVLIEETDSNKLNGTPTVSVTIIPAPKPAEKQKHEISIIIDPTKSLDKTKAVINE